MTKVLKDLLDKKKHEIIDEELVNKSHAQLPILKPQLSFNSIHSHEKTEARIPLSKVKSETEEKYNVGSPSKRSNLIKEIRKVSTLIMKDPDEGQLNVPIQRNMSLTKVKKRNSSQ